MKKHPHRAFAAIATVLTAAILTSCSSDEPKSSENYIEKFSLDSISPIEINVQSEQSLVYIWTESQNYEKLPKATPSIAVSEGATISQNSVNWADGFKVSAENGELREYAVKIDTAIPKKYSFESWSAPSGYFVPSDLRWASGNAGIKLALGMLSRNKADPEIYPTKMTDKGYIGNAAVMETIEGGNVFGKQIPIFSGNLFLGTFNTSKAITDALAAIELGRIYPAKPKSISGYYKYKEGAGTFINNGVADLERHDRCDIYAFFYQSDIANGDTTLNVHNINTDSLITNSNRILAFSRLTNCEQTEGDAFHPFKLEFAYKAEPDLANHRYKLAIIFAASKEGDSYAGKIGSRLTVDEIEIEDVETLL